MLESTFLKNRYEIGTKMAKKAICYLKVALVRSLSVFKGLKDSLSGGCKTQEKRPQTRRLWTPQGTSPCWKTARVKSPASKKSLSFTNVDSRLNTEPATDEIHMEDRNHGLAWTKPNNGIYNTQNSQQTYA